MAKADVKRRIEELAKRIGPKAVQGLVFKINFVSPDGSVRRCIFGPDGLVPVDEDQGAPAGGRR